MSAKEVKFNADAREKMLSGVDVLWQEFAVGFLIIVAVAIDQWLRRVSA